MQKREGQIRIALYGADLWGLTLDAPHLDDRNFVLEFLPYRTDRRLSEFDGVITFQRLFEQYKPESNFMNSWTAHSYDRNELDKREKEADMLIKNGGFLAFLLHVPFRDHVHENMHSTEYNDTDLAKRFLNWRNLYRTDLDQRLTGLRCIRDEFRKFFELYGAVCTTFSYHGGVSWRNLALCGSNPVSMIIADSMFYIPCLLPDRDSPRKEEFYRLLTDAICTCVKKLRVALPTWADNFILPSERQLREEQESISSRLDEIEQQRAVVTRFKRVLVGDGDSLVEDVVYLLTEGFKLSVSHDDHGQEDLRILDDDGHPQAFIEVKGTTRGVKREHVNQADSHRERAELPSKFPTVLLINTHGKNARSVQEKDQPVASEQVIHAVKMHVLILRTLDLLRFFVGVEKGRHSAEDFLIFLKTEVGWLEVLDEGINVHQE